MTKPRVKALVESVQIDAIRAALEEVVVICTDLAIGYAGHKGAPTALMDAVSHIRALAIKEEDDE